MFDDVLIESAGKDRKKGTLVTFLVSAIVHVVLIGAIVAAGLYVHKNPDVIEKPIRAFMVQAAPPPPPPPPPPAASHASSTPKVTPHVETPKTHPTFHQPTQTPKEVPQTQQTKTDTSGGVEGGVAGGVKGGVAGGVVGGVVGGTLGGTLGGQLGGQVGGQGDSPVHVGGDVKAPVTVSRTEPEYTEIARKARIEGIVVIEAVIDRNGDVTDARILKGLPMGLGDAALTAVKRWKFKPGTLNGQPVPVYYNLIVTFRLQ